MFLSCSSLLTTVEPAVLYSMKIHWLNLFSLRTWLLFGKSEFSLINLAVLIYFNTHHCTFIDKALVVFCAEIWQKACWKTFAACSFVYESLITVILGNWLFLVLHLFIYWFFFCGGALLTELIFKQLSNYLGGLVAVSQIFSIQWDFRHFQMNLLKTIYQLKMKAAWRDSVILILLFHCLVEN